MPYFLILKKDLAMRSSVLFLFLSAHLAMGNFIFRSKNGL